MRAKEVSKRIVLDANAGWGWAGGASVTTSGSITNPSDWNKPIEGVSGGFGKLGAGFGAAASAGQYTSTSIASPTLSSTCGCR